MGKQKNKDSFSLSAFVEQTAQMLRGAIKRPKEKRKKMGLSISNRIEQIALLLRSETRKIKSRKKKKY